MKKTVLTITLTALVGSAVAENLEFTNASRERIVLYVGNQKLINQNGKITPVLDNGKALVIMPGMSDTARVATAPDALTINNSRNEDRVSFDPRNSLPSGCSGVRCDYAQPQLMGKTKFKISDGNRQPGNFKVEALD